MGGGLSCFGQPSPKILPKEDAHDHQNHNTKRRSLNTVKNKKKNKRQLHPQDDQKQQQLKMVEAMEHTTLEEWLLASPSLTKSCINGGELFVLKQSSSNRVFPSLGAGGHADLSYKSRDSFLSLERSLRVEDEVERQETEVSSVKRSKSGKVKKKVTFRLPDEADIFIFYSPDVKFRE